jgi:hypothetical protein
MSDLVVLRGDPRRRGLGQALACPAMAPAVRDAIRLRLAAAPDTPRGRAFLAAQREATAALAPEALAEIAGIGEGFGLAAAEIFDFLHLGCLADLAQAPVDTDGCTAFARAGVVAKNRDFRPEHAALQRIFVHADPAWGGRSVLCLGSLGAPGAWSSGMNSAGLALADTQIATADHGPGLLRYFLMNRLLADCATVAAALALIRALPHAGGGSLVLADAGGAAAAVELRHGRVDIVEAATLAHTNHYEAAPEPLSAVAHSLPRVEALRAALAADPARDARALLAMHAPAALCRHAPDPSPTLAGAVWDTRRGVALLALGPPCCTPWRRFALGAEGWRETHATA